MSIASSYSERYNKLPEDFMGGLDCWGGDCSVPHTMHYGEPFKAFLCDMKEEAVEVTYDEEYCCYDFKFSDGSSAELDNYRDTFRSYN